MCIITLVDTMGILGDKDVLSIMSPEPYVSPFNRRRLENRKAVAKRVYQGVICPLFGHRPQSGQMDTPWPPSPKMCRCGTDILGHETETRLRHVPDCFLKGHTCVKIDNRDGHHEFMCSSCGHPILIEEERSGYAGKRSMHKRQRYLCSVFGHRVHEVTKRDGMTEYACGCGHSFLKSKDDLTEVKHPLVCLFSGHFVTHLARREGYSEYLCRNCGHTFYFGSES